jgi:hypothetical protein
MYRNVMAERVAVGAALLDAELPGWAERIELGLLDLGSPRCCVLGQLYGTYSVGLEAVGLDWGPSCPERSRERGFTAFPGGGDTFAGLTAAWRGEVAARVG